VINATLNPASTILLLILLLTGRWLIGRRRIAQHRLVMLTAVAISTLFLISHVYYHVHVGSVRFPGTGWRRPVYFTILISPVVLAIVIVPMVIVTLTRGLRELSDRHWTIARWTFPLWLYVSMTGVPVYFMLYQWFAPPSTPQFSTGLLGLALYPCG